MAKQPENKITQKHETKIQLGNVIAIGQFGQVTESAKPGQYNVIKLEHSWDTKNYGSAYLFMHDSVNMNSHTILDTIDYIDNARIDGAGYGLFSKTDESFEALDRAWTSAPADGTGFVADSSSRTFDIYTNADHTVFLLDADSIYFHSLLWPQWTQMKNQQYITERIQGWGLENGRVIVSYYDEYDKFQIEVVNVSSKQRKMDIIIKTMLKTIEKLKQER